MSDLCEDLLKEWCNGLLRRQIQGTGDKRLDGGICCPACGRIHGRCSDSMYPFLRMARQEGGSRWIQAAEAVFEWTENTVSRLDGSVMNDIDSSWDGITVFYAIQLADCLAFHGDLLEPLTRERWTVRLEAAAEFLYHYDDLKDNNINYPISNALALQKCGQLLHIPRYIQKAAELAQLAVPCFTDHYLLLGEGIPRFETTPRGCCPVDIGYNVEESLPALLLYGHLSRSSAMAELASRGLAAHLKFMLDDGGWDNSFGTRKFKWTYWGSRTSDGCALAYLLAEDGSGEFTAGALRNLLLLKECTWDGLLAGGPHYRSAGQASCVHHTFSHAKVLAGILDLGLQEKLDQGAFGQMHQARGALPRRQRQGMQYYSEIDTWIVSTGQATATVTACDWEYLPGGHTGGGTLSMVHHAQAGPVLCAGTAEYRLLEPNNMQIPRNIRHECLALRIEAQIDGICYSSIYENQVRIRTVPEEDQAGTYRGCGGAYRIYAEGILKDISHRPCLKADLPYCLEYHVHEKGIGIRACLPAGSGGCLIIPLISRRNEALLTERKRIRIDKSRLHPGAFVELSSAEKLELPYGTERIFNLVPGLEAVRVDLIPAEGKAELELIYGENPDNFGNIQEESG